jgi:hypothetical protein
MSSYCDTEGNYFIQCPYSRGAGRSASKNVATKAVLQVGLFNEIVPSFACEGI